MVSDSPRTQSESVALGMEAKSADDHADDTAAVIETVLDVRAPDIEYVVAGDGRLLPKCELIRHGRKIADELGWQERVWLLPIIALAERAGPPPSPEPDRKARDAALRELAALLRPKPRSVAAAALQIVELDRRYSQGAWLRHQHAPTNPHQRGSSLAALWDAKKASAAGRLPGRDQLERILGRK
jgi:hypothetical protein